MRNTDFRLSRLSHCHNIVRQTHAAHGAVFPDGLVQQSQCLCALHCNYRVFPDAHLGVIDETCILECAYECASEVTQTDEALTHLRGRQVHAMERNIASRLDDAE